MKSIRLKHLILLLLVPMLLTAVGSCKRTLSKDEVMGNHLSSAPADFIGIQGNTPIPTRKYQVDGLPDEPLDPNPSITFQFGRENPTTHEYGGDLVYFNNKLSHEVTWFINFKGLISGAQKTITGTSDSLSAAIWDGAADGVRFFIPSETITYEISFLGSAIKYSGTLVTLDAEKTSGAKRYTGFSFPKNGGGTIKYFLVDDMGDVVTGAGIRVSYRDAADNNNALFYVVADKAVDGRFSFYMKATDYNRNTYCGGFGGESLTELYNTVNESDPSKVYVNAYVYGYGRANSALNVLLFEDDSWVAGTTPKPTVRPDVTKNDMWMYIIQVDWIGWKLVSIPYSSFRTANNPNAGGSGNRIREPQKLAGMGMELDSYPVGGSTVELALDAVYLTTNAAFQP